MAEARLTIIAGADSIARVWPIWPLVTFDEASAGDAGALVGNPRNVVSDCHRGRVDPEYAI